MTLKQPKTKNTPIVSACKGRVRDYLNEYKPDAFMSFISQGQEFDSPINLLIAEYLGVDTLEQVKLYISKAKSGDVILQESGRGDFPDVIFAVMPIWDTALSNEEKYLSRCYRNAIKLAKGSGYRRLVVPALGRGKSNFPHKRIVRLSLSAMLSELAPPIEEVMIVCAEDVMHDAYAERIASLKG